MELVLDANILFAALIRDSNIRHYLLLSQHSFFVPEFVFEEIAEHKDELRDKTTLSESQIKNLLDQIIILAHIRVIPFDDFKEWTDRALKITPDKDDVQYFSLAMKLRCGIWSNDKQLQHQSVIKVYTSEEIFLLS